MGGGCAAGSKFGSEQHQYHGKTRRIQQVFRLLPADRGIEKREHGQRERCGEKQAMYALGTVGSVPGQRRENEIGGQQCQQQKV